MNKLIAISIASASLTFGMVPVLAEVDAKIHKLCLEAKDYLGCVKAMKGESMSTSKAKVGNKCQTQFAYIGGGNCQRVGCKYGWWATGRDNNNSIVAGKSNWECKTVFRNGLFLSGSLILEEVAPVGFDEKCPSIEPEVGWNSSCETTAEKTLAREMERLETERKEKNKCTHRDRMNGEC